MSRVSFLPHHRKQKEEISPPMTSTALLTPCTAGKKTHSLQERSCRVFRQLAEGSWEPAPLGKPEAHLRVQTLGRLGQRGPQTLEVGGTMEGGVWGREFKTVIHKYVLLGSSW